MAGIGPRTKLDDSTVARRLEGLPDWELREARLRREFRFDGFTEAFAFMTRVAFVAERLDHHPNWSNVYDRVTIELYTHDVGGVTDRDFEFAEAVARIAIPR